MRGTISTGIWLVFFGIVALLHNFDVVHFNFYAILKYWPLIIISVGINLMFQYKNFGTAIIIAANVAICAFLAVIGYTSEEKFNWKDKINFESSVKTKGDSPHSVIIPLKDSVSNPEFSFNISAATITIDSTTHHFLEAKSTNKSIGFSLEKKRNSIELDGSITNKKAKDNFVTLAFHKDFVWDLSFNIAASRFDADFSSCQFSNLELNGAAADIQLKLGNPVKRETTIEVNTAASACKISIPKDAACAVEMATILSSNKLDGFTKVDDQWQTANFNSASQKYIIEINGAANSLTIERY